MLICPKCGQKLNKINNTYKCINNHSYDIAKDGYVNLLLSRSHAGDCKEMVNARYAFLNNGYYYPLANKICEILSSYIDNDDYILDCGCGTGYYDGIIRKQYPNILGCDISKDAIIKACKNNKGLLYFVANGISIPLPNNSISCILNIFSPTFADEAARLLNDDGIMIIVAPGANHLIELKKEIYDDAYKNDELAPSFNEFDLIDTTSVCTTKSIPNKDLINITKMTPYFYKTNHEGLNNLLSIEALDLTIEFKIYIYKKNKLL